MIARRLLAYYGTCNLLLWGQSVLLRTLAIAARMCSARLARRGHLESAVNTEGRTAFCRFVCLFAWPLARLFVCEGRPEVLWVQLCGDKDVRTRNPELCQQLRHKILRLIPDGI